ncbi:MAG: metallophosphoesterase [Chitinophagales bacterium]
MFVFFSVILAFEFYAYQAFATVFTGSSILPIIYFTGTIIIISSILLYFNFQLREKLKVPRQLLMANFFLLFIPKIFTVVLLIPEDIIRLVKGAINGVSNLAGNSLHLYMGRSETWSIIVLIIAGSLTAAFIYGALFNVYNYKVRKVPVKLIRLPKSFDGLKVVQISDIHSGSLSDKHAIQKAVDKINKLEPDLIFFTGDLVNNIAVEAMEFVDIFSQLKAVHGVYSILGNHDYGDYMYWTNQEDKIKNLELLKSLHQKMGWRLLLNEHVHIEKENDAIVVAGVENWSARKGFHSYGKLEKALNGIQDAFTVLLLSHDPSHWEAEILDHPAKVDITFSGHTHGMQFGFEFFNIKWSPVKYFYKQWAGLYSKKDQHLYVNRGFGVIGYPGRVGILPEITLFTLHSTSRQSQLQ